MRYDVKITETALADMNKIYEYIAYQLLAPENEKGRVKKTKIFSHALFTIKQI